MARRKNRAEILADIEQPGLVGDLADPPLLPLFAFGQLLSQGLDIGLDFGPASPTRHRLPPDKRCVGGWPRRASFYGQGGHHASGRGGRAERVSNASRSETAWGPEAEQACGLAC